MNGTESLSYWLIVRDKSSRVEVMTVWLTGHGEALPVFSFEEDARSFCERRGLGSGWRSKEISTDELALVLFGLCGDVERVALDPLPQIDAEVMVPLTCMRCEGFLEFLFRENTSHDHIADTQDPAKGYVRSRPYRWAAGARRSVPLAVRQGLLPGPDPTEALSPGAHRTADSPQLFGYGSTSSATAPYLRGPPPALL